MDIQKNLFAKNDIDAFSVRFVAALKITSKKFFNGNYNAPAIVFAILHDYNDSLNGYQRNVVSNVTLSKETAHLAKEFFVEVFNNKEAMLDYLNKEISDRWYRVKTKPVKSFKTAQEEVNDIVKLALGTGFFNSIDANFDM